MGQQEKGMETNDRKVRRKINQRNFQGQSQTPEGKGKNLKLRNQERRENKRKGQTEAKLATQEKTGNPDF